MRELVKIFIDSFAFDSQSACLIIAQVMKESLCLGQALSLFLLLIYGLYLSLENRIKDKKTPVNTIERMDRLTRVREVMNHGTSHSS